RAQLAADAGLRIDQHDAILGALVGGAGRAHRDAVRLIAMQTRSGKIDGPTCGSLAGFEGVHAVEPGTVRIDTVGVLIGERRGIAAAVPLLAAGGAGVAADTGIEVDDEAQLFAGAGGEGGHRSPPRAPPHRGTGSGADRGAGSLTPARPT